MTISPNFTSDVETGLVERVRARGISLDDYIQELVAKEARFMDRRAILDLIRTAARRR